MCGLVPSYVLWVVLQTGDELFHFFALKADLVDCRKQRKPAEENRHPHSVSEDVCYQDTASELVADQGTRQLIK